VPAPSRPQQPSIGRIVIYRNRDGVDMPAIITALTDEPGTVHLTVFPPPGAGAPILSHQFGTPLNDAEEPRQQTWRWPERVQ
jgi:hypothetical protein